jgi:hypothetical protein
LEARFNEPVGLAVSEDDGGNWQLFVADVWNQRIQVFSQTRCF